MLYRVNFKTSGFERHTKVVSSNNRDNAIKKASKEENMPRKKVISCKLDEPRVPSLKVLVKRAKARKR